MHLGLMTDKSNIFDNIIKEQYKYFLELVENEKQY